MSEPTQDMPSAAAGPDAELLAALADDFGARLRRREHPTIEEYVARHPALAERIRNVLSAVALMEQGRVDATVSTEGPGATIGRYKLLERIGEGGFGVVYMAEQQAPVRRKVALKVIKPGMDSRQVLARFDAERQALAIMDHPNIAKVFDGGVTDTGRPYFVMELVKGEPITSYCDANQLPPRQRLELFVQVCDAVQHAHQKGIIHRDLKPTNVLVAVHDTTPVVKVIDFGVAKALGQALTDETLFTGFAQLLGTPLYMSPEQAGHSALDVDTRSDIYSLGVLLYELLTGTTPFDRERFRRAADDEIRRIIREEEPPRPSTRLSASQDSLPSISAQRHTEPAKLTKLVRGELDWIVMKALEKDRARRYETATGFGSDVRRYLAGEAVQAVPPSAAYRVKKFARRNKGTLVTASIIGVALLFAVASIGWAARDRAARHAKVAGQVEVILTEVDQLEREQKWPEAFAAARRAEAAVAGGGADAAAVRRVDAALKGLELIDRLERIRMLPYTTVEWRSRAALDQEYARAFREYDVDLDALPTDASIGRLKVRPGLCTALAAALDQWVLVARRDPAGRERLVTIARGIDPDPVRDRLRSTADRPAPQAREELRKLAASVDVRAHRPETLVSLTGMLNLVELSEPALQILRDAQRVYPSDYHVNSVLAVALLGAGDEDGAVRFATAAAALRPYSWSAHHNLGLYLSRRKDRDQAAAAFRTAIELAPDVPDAYTSLARVLNELGKPDEALAVCRKAIERVPRGYYLHFSLASLLRKNGKIDEANAAVATGIQLARKEIEIDPKNAAGHQLQIGRALREQGKLNEAATIFRQVIEADPKNWLGYADLAFALRALGRQDEAIEAFRKAIELDPVSAGNHRSNLALLLRLRGKRDEALAVYRKSIEVRSRDANAHIGVGMVLSDQKKYDEAIAAYRTAIEIDPNQAPAYHNTANILKEQKKLDEAVAAYQMAARLDPRFGHPYVGLGEVYYEQGQLDKAIAAYAKAIELETAPTNEVAAVHANIVEMRKGKDFDLLRDREDFKRLVAAVDEKRPLRARAWELATDPDPSLRNLTRAVALAERAVAEAPAEAGCWHTLGVARYRAGDFSSAVAALSKFRELRTDNAEWSNPFFLAMAHWQLGSKEEARRWYEIATTWMDKNAPKSESLIRFRSEAAELLGVDDARRTPSTTSAATATSQSLAK